MEWGKMLVLVVDLRMYNEVSKLQIFSDRFLAKWIR